jgi:hypothetical protein
MIMIMLLVLLLSIMKTKVLSRESRTFFVTRMPVKLKKRLILISMKACLPRTVLNGIIICFGDNDVTS